MYEVDTYVDAAIMISCSRQFVATAMTVAVMAVHTTIKANRSRFPSMKERATMGVSSMRNVSRVIMARNAMWIIWSSNICNVPPLGSWTFFPPVVSCKWESELTTYPTYMFVGTYLLLWRASMLDPLSSCMPGFWRFDFELKMRGPSWLHLQGNPRQLTLPLPRRKSNDVNQRPR